MNCPKIGKYIDIEKTDAAFGNTMYYFKYRDVNFYKAETEILFYQFEDINELNRLKKLEEEKLKTTTKTHFNLI